MGSVVSNLFGSVLMRLAVIFGALAAMTAAAIVIGWVVFQSIATDMSVLSDQRLPELRNSARVVATSERIRSVLSSILVADDAAALDALSGKTRMTIADMTQSTEALGEARAQDLTPLISKVEAALAALNTARLDAFRSADQVANEVENAQRLATQASALLDQASDDAYFDLVLGGDGTIDSIDETLTQLIETDFALYQATLELRAEVNLISGLALSVWQTRDPAMLSILGDLASAAQDRLDALLPIVSGAEATADLAALVTAAQPGYQQIFALEGSRLRPEEILSVRQEIDAALSSALDDIYFQLVINSDDAKVANEESIRGLMDDQVLRIRRQAALDSATKTFFASAMQTALARDQGELSMLQDDLLVKAAKLRDALAGATEEVTAKLSEILTIADPETGIAATRAAAFIANDAAAAAARSATVAVQEISAEIGAFAARAQDEIDGTADSLNAEVALARMRMQQVGWASVALVLLAPLLIWGTVTRPLNRVTAVTERLAQGDLSEITGIGGQKGEIGRMARALTVFRDGALERIQLQEDDKARQAEMLEKERAAEQEKRAEEIRQREAEEERARAERAREAEEQARNEELRAAADAERKARADEQAAVVDALAQSLRRLSTGDLSHRIETEFPGTYEALRQDYNAALETLADLIRRIGESSGMIDASSSEIAASSLDLSRRTENAAATLEETAAALSELTSSVTSAARGATEASATVDTVKKDTETSREVMHQAVAAMGEIEDSSTKIAKIVEVIDSIAFQTNLLALNAGVEAARAGDAGRGFAVVASEVRILAHRCSEAATQINTLISESTDHVEKGVSLIDRTSEALETILQGVTNVSQNVSEIAVSASEQSGGIAEINTAVEQLDRSTQQNAAMFEETTAASQSLTNEASTLAKLVAGFVVTRPADRADDGSDIEQRA
ncbi:methyl-accepting chemotaxis protein [Roseobacter sp. YSTF-M11]|uniref:Methyl-accepting chemotaxis protein n=1 Tax=Roseobacter insulae TaxID=2859783 RepID=A0A9X1K474_9RHOB|nr:HAMP domain-containing methyl-accepting chemotaxis protein [Roseobacter insulae]MBW4710308.1 methyl-accepting chemotaxis protein [Roseobacter insulae]